MVTIVPSHWWTLHQIQIVDKKIPDIFFYDTIIICRNLTPIIVYQNFNLTYPIWDSGKFSGHTEILFKDLLVMKKLLKFR